MAGGSPGSHLVGLLTRRLRSRWQLLSLFIVACVPLCDGAEAPDLICW